MSQSRFQKTKSYTAVNGLLGYDDVPAQREAGMLEKGTQVEKEGEHSMCNTNLATACSEQADRWFVWFLR